MLKIYQRKSGGNWYLRGTVAGQSIHESTGTNNKEFAEAIRIRRETQALERRAYGAKATITFAEAALSYIETGGETRFLHPILEYFGPNTKLSEVNNVTVLEAAKKLYPKKSNATINRQLITPVSSIINAAADSGLCEHKRFRRLKVIKKPRRWLSPEEMERLINECDQHIIPVIGFLIGGGCRTGEALSIDSSTYYQNTGEAYLPKTKNGHPRMIRLPKRAQEMVESRGIPEAGAICRTPKGKPYIMRQNGGGQISASFRKACNKANLETSITPHCLRHTWATWFYSQTRDFGSLLDLGGWQKADMANHYRKIAPSDLGEKLLSFGWDYRYKRNLIEHHPTSEIMRLANSTEFSFKN